MGVKIREQPKGSGIWYVFISHNGRRKSKKIGRDKALAKQVAKQIEARLVLGDLDLGEKPAPTFGDYAKDWTEIHVAAQCKETTARSYRGILKKYLLPTWKTVPVKDITRLKVKQYLMGLMNDGVSRPLVRKIQMVISGVLNLAVDAEEITANPAQRLGGIYGRENTKNEKAGGEAYRSLDAERTLPAHGHDP